MADAATGRSLSAHPATGDPVSPASGCPGKEPCLTVVATAERLGVYAPYFERAGYKVVHWPYPRGYAAKWKWYKKVIAELRAGGYDVVHIHSSGLKWGASYCAWRAGCKPVYTFHNVFRSHWYSWPWHWWLRWSAKHWFGCVFQTISDSVHDNELNYYFNKTHKVYNWYGPSRFFPARAGERAAVRKELGISEDAFVIISVGGCSHVKRHTDVIRALPLLLKDVPEIVYLHLGEGVALEEEKELAETLSVAGHVRFCGNRADVRKFLVASDVYMMPSKFEGISLTTIEAMACGIPAVLYDVPGLRDFNVGGQRALIVPEDPRELSAAVLQLRRSPHLCETLTAEARSFVNANFSMDTNVRKIFELYKS